MINIKCKSTPTLRRHAPGSVRVHLSYGRLTMQDVKSACDGMEDNKKKDQQLRKQKWAAMSKHELVQARREIDRELAKRKCL